VGRRTVETWIGGAHAVGGSGRVTRHLQLVVGAGIWAVGVAVGVSVGMGVAMVIVGGGGCSSIMMVDGAKVALFLGIGLPNARVNIGGGHH